MKKLLIICIVMMFYITNSLAGQNEEKNKNYPNQTPKSSNTNGQHYGIEGYDEMTYKPTSTTAAPRDTTDCCYSTSPSSGTINNTNQDVRNITNRISDDN